MTSLLKIADILTEITGYLLEQEDDIIPPKTIEKLDTIFKLSTEDKKLYLNRTKLWRKKSSNLIGVDTSKPGQLSYAKLAYLTTENDKYLDLENYKPTEDKERNIMEWIYDYMFTKDMFNEYKLLQELKSDMATGSIQVNKNVQKVLNLPISLGTESIQKSKKTKSNSDNSDSDRDKGSKIYPEIDYGLVPLTLIEQEKRKRKTNKELLTHISHHHVFPFLETDPPGFLFCINLHPSSMLCCLTANCPSDEIKYINTMSYEDAYAYCDKKYFIPYIHNKLMEHQGEYKMLPQQEELSLMLIDIINKNLKSTQKTSIDNEPLRAELYSLNQSIRRLNDQLISTGLSKTEDVTDRPVFTKPTRQDIPEKTTTDIKDKKPFKFSWE